MDVDYCRIVDVVMFAYFVEYSRHHCRHSPYHVAAVVAVAAVEVERGIVYPPVVVVVVQLLPVDVVCSAAKYDEVAKVVVVAAALAAVQVVSNADLDFETVSAAVVVVGTYADFEAAVARRMVVADLDDAVVPLLRIAIRPLRLHHFGEEYYHLDTEGCASWAEWYYLDQGYYYRYDRYLG